MAEIVQKRMERFAPALLKLKESKIFTEEEINKIIKKVRKNEHRLASGSKCLEDYKSLIKDEERLLMELIKRRKFRSPTEKNKDLDWIFIKRIVNTYRRGLERYPSDYNFNMSYFEFLKYFLEQHPQFIGEQVEKMIKTFGDKPEVFRKGAAWFYHCHRIEETRRILLRGQAIHPQNLEIYLDLIELEIKNYTAKGIQKRLKKYIDAIVSNKVTYRFLEEAIKIFDNYEKLQEVVDYAVENLLTCFSSEPDVWHTVALRELKGNYHAWSEKDGAKKSSTYSIERAVSRYKEGISKLPLDKKPLLWKRYLDTLVNLVKDQRNPQSASLLRKGLSEAEEAKVTIDESYYMAWMECCENDEALIGKKLEEGTRVHGKSVMLWALYLKHHILKHDSKPGGTSAGELKIEKHNWDSAREVFGNAVAALGPKALKIWEIYIDFNLLTSPVQKVDALHFEAIAQPYPEIATVFKPRFLLWMIASRGIEAGRELYLKIADKPPYSRQLHQEMLLAEQMEYGPSNYRKQQNSPNGTSNLRKDVLQLWTKQFGSEDLEVWFQRIAFAKERGAPNINEKIRKIYEEAIRTLSDNMLAPFKKQFDAVESVAPFSIN